MSDSLPGLTDCGVRLHDGGAFFCVWAPNAEAVSLTGDFANWSTEGLACSKGRDGCWFINVPQAAIGQEYKYIISYQGRKLLRNDPRALQLTSSGDNSIIVDAQFDWGSDSYQLPRREDMVIYELHVGTFMRDDPALPGTFHLAANKLDYLHDLGVNVVEVMPCNSVWMDHWWGYTPDNLYAVEASYGGRRAFQEFVRAAHQKGIGVILDVVYNHLSQDAGLDLWEFDGWSKVGYGGIYFYNDSRAHTPWGEGRPDYGRPEVRRYITDNARMWLRDCHVDGLRVDATLFIRNTEGRNNDPAHDIPEGWQLLQEVNIAAVEARPGALMIAEDLQGNAWITKPTTEENGAGYHTQWDPSFSAILKDVLDQPIDESRDMEKLRFALTNSTNGDPFERVIYSESHDTAAAANGGARLDETIEPGNAGGLYARRRAALAAGLLMTTPGIPMLFQGQEFQEGGAFTHYASLDWTKTETYAGMLQLYHDLIALRKNQYSNTAGLLGCNIDVFHIDQGSKVLAFHRWDQAGPRDNVVVVANFSNQKQLRYSVAFPATGTWQVRFNSDWRGYSPDFTSVLTNSIEVEPDAADKGKMTGNVDIGPYSILIFSQDS